jgi:glycerophosphoryl diester phosphodiesterase
LVGPRIDQPWLQSLQRDVGGLVGVHVDVETLDEHTSLLSNAYSLRMPVFSYSLAGDKIHLDVLKRHGNRYGYWPSGAIIDGDANTFCRTLQAAHR